MAVNQRSVLAAQGFTKEEVDRFDDSCGLFPGNDGQSAPRGKANHVFKKAMTPEDSQERTRATDVFVIVNHDAARVFAGQNALNTVKTVQLGKKMRRNSRLQRIETDPNSSRRLIDTTAHAFDPRSFYQV